VDVINVDARGKDLYYRLPASGDRFRDFEHLNIVGQMARSRAPGDRESAHAFILMPLGSKL
jgi:hypothetical protein